MSKEILHDFFNLLHSNNTEKLLNLFAEEPEIDDQVLGQIKGKEQFHNFVESKSKWLSNDLQASPELFKITEDNEHYAIEFVLNLDNYKSDLPVAVIADKKGDKFSQIRIYHSTWPYTKSHSVRKPHLPIRHDLEEPEAVRQYMDGLKNGDPQKILNLFAEDGYFREPSGVDYKYEGMERLTELYTNFLAKGGIILDHCTATFNGQTTAIEFIATEWAGISMPHQAGIAFYDTNENGKITGARVYDDVNPPI